jgi:uncharacterized membrane protein YtjA (UPF0391 family)
MQSGIGVAISAQAAGTMLLRFAPQRRSSLLQQVAGDQHVVLHNATGRAYFEKRCKPLVFSASVRAFLTALAGASSGIGHGHATETTMIKYAIIFAVISLVAAALGFSGVAAGAAGIAKILFGLFLILAVIFIVLAALGVGAAKNIMKK